MPMLEHRGKDLPEDGQQDECLRRVVTIAFQRLPSLGRRLKSASADQKAPEVEQSSGGVCRVTRRASYPESESAGTAA